jgi:hypothetical protein
LDDSPDGNQGSWHLADGVAATKSDAASSADTNDAFAIRYRVL